MSVRIPGLVVAATLFGGLAAAQELPPGYLDPGPVLRAAAEAIGVANLRCVTISGSAYAGMVGQQAAERVRSGLAAWPPADELHADHELGRRDHGRRVRP